MANEAPRRNVAPKRMQMGWSRKRFEGDSSARGVTVYLLVYRPGGSVKLLDIRQRTEYRRFPFRQ